MCTSSQPPRARQAHKTWRPLCPRSGMCVHNHGPRTHSHAHTGRGPVTHCRLLRPMHPVKHRRTHPRAHTTPDTQTQAHARRTHSLTRPASHRTHTTTSNAPGRGPAHARSQAGARTLSHTRLIAQEEGTERRRPETAVPGAPGPAGRAEPAWRLRGGGALGAGRGGGQSRPSRAGAVTSARRARASPPHPPRASRGALPRAVR